MDRSGQTKCDDRFPCCGLVTFYARMGLHSCNLLRGTNLKLIHTRIRLKKFDMSTGSAAASYYVTLVAMDPSSCWVLTF